MDVNVFSRCYCLQRLFLLSSVALLIGKADFFFFWDNKDDEELNFLLGTMS